MGIRTKFIDWWLGESKYSPYSMGYARDDIEREKDRRVARAQVLLEVSQEPTVESSHAVSIIPQPVHFIGQDARQRWTVMGCSAKLTSDTLVSPITSQVTCEPCILSQRYQAKVRVR